MNQIGRGMDEIDEKPKEMKKNQKGSSPSLSCMLPEPILQIRIFSSEPEPTTLAKCYGRPIV